MPSGPSSKHSSRYLPVITQGGSSRSSSRDSSGTAYSGSSRESRDSRDQYSGTTMGHDDDYYHEPKRSTKHRVPDHEQKYITTTYSKDDKVAVTNHQMAGYDEDEPRTRDARSSDYKGTREYREHKSSSSSKHRSKR